MSTAASTLAAAPATTAATTSTLTAATAAAATPVPRSSLDGKTGDRKDSDPTAPAGHATATTSAAAKYDPRIATKIAAKERANEPYYSFEYFPPKVDDGKYAMYDRLEEMSHLSPSFIDITWRLRTKQLSIEVASTAQQLCGVETQLHLCVAGLTNAQLIDIVGQVRKAGIRNILALRGDPLDGQSEWKRTDGGCRYSSDLVSLIRAQPYGHEFSVGVAGYPEGLGECSYEEELKHLKLKVDAGADYIISQLFWDVPKYLKWIADCRAIGIKVPILAGLLPIQSYASFRAMSKLNPQVSVPPAITEAVERIKNDDKAIREYGVGLGVRMCRELMRGGVLGFHWYTLNLATSTAKILDELALIPPRPSRPLLPYKSAVRNGTRPGEDVRPIFWSNRPQSYLMRTANWDEYPNARWGDRRSAAFGSLDDHHLFFLHAPKVVDRIKLWGAAPASVNELSGVFASYLRGTIDRLPWCDRKIEPETIPIVAPLCTLNEAGFWTINSQPAANAVPSDHPALGWGPKGGFLYQKAYLELFVSPAALNELVSVIDKSGRYPTLTYHAEQAGTASVSDARSTIKGVTAVTWGVFPNDEIVQPTVVDPASFHVWKDEAFGLWLSQWAAIYAPESGARKLIETVHGTYWLLSIVDHDFMRGDAIWKLFGEFVPALKTTPPASIVDAKSATATATAAAAATTTTAAATAAAVIAPTLSSPAPTAAAIASTKK